MCMICDLERVTVEIMDNVFQIYFEATSSGSSTNSIMAIDDIQIDDRVCLKPGDCTFEWDMCTYSNDHSNDDFDWLRASYVTSSGYTGPTIDHTLQTGWGKYCV